MLAKVHRILVTARDGGVDPRFATATVTVLVADLPDENPKFSQSKYEVQVPENVVEFDVIQVQVCPHFYYLGNVAVVGMLIIFIYLF